MTRHTQHVRSIAAICLVACLWATPAARAGLAPENVAVVVNKDSWVSKAIANHYVQMRNIPAENVIYLDIGRLSTFEEIDIKNFRSDVLEPMLAEIKKRGLEKQIDCIAYAPDMPYAARFGSLPGAKGKYPAIAATTALTFLYESVLKGDRSFANTGGNYYFRRTTRAQTNRWTPDQAKLQTQASQAMAAKDYAKAESLLRQLLTKRPQEGSVYYRIALCRASKGDTNGAAELLFRAADKGFRSKGILDRIEAFKGLKTHKDYKKLAALMAEPAMIKGMKLQPTAGFRHSYGWNGQGRRVDDDTGRKYYLSTMLGVTSGRGTSVTGAIEALARAKLADGRKPRGTIYFMANSDIRSRKRQPEFASAIEQLAALGVRGQIVKGKLPTGRSDVMGIVAGSPFLSIPKSNMTILPGAICENYTSWGGVMHQWGGQTPLTAFLQGGAAGSSGTVTEPTAVNAKFPSSFVHCIYAQGFTLSEAFYQSVRGPYQLLIVGDPMCQPWANIPNVSLEGLIQGQTVKDRVDIAPKAVGAGAGDIKTFELFIAGKRVAVLPKGKATHIRTAAGADGYHEIRCVAVSGNAVETRTSGSVGFVVNNRGMKVLVRPSGSATVPLGMPLRLSVVAEDAKVVIVRHNGREVARGAGGRQTLTIDSNVVGMGPVRLHVTAEIPDLEKTWNVRAAPITFTVAPPRRLAPQRADPKRLGKGPLVRIGTRAPIVVDLRKQNKGTLALKAGATWTLKAVLSARGNGMHKLQFRRGSIRSLKFAGKTVRIEPGDSGWQFVPLNLAKGGYYHLEVTGKATGSSLPDIRFGQTYTTSLRPANAFHQK